MSRIAKWVLMVTLVWGLMNWGPALRGAGEVTLKDLIDGAVTQLDLALRQALASAAAPSPENARLYSHQVLNLLVGQGGSGYDANAQVKGDDHGLTNYAAQIKAALQDPQYAQRLNMTIINMTIDTVIAYFNSALDRAQRALSASDLGAVQSPMKEAIAFLSTAKGRVEDVAPLGGLLYLKAQIAQL